MGFLKPDRGVVKVAGENICSFSERELQEVRRKVTMVFQNGALFDSITVGENVAFPMRERGEMAEDQILQVVKGLLEMVGGGRHGEPAAVGLVDGNEAVNRDCAGTGIAARGSAV